MKDNHAFVKALIGTILFIDVFDGVSLFVALPKIALSLEVDLMQTDWTIISFLLAMALFIFLGKWLGKKYGNKNIFIAAQVLYVVSSFLCGISTSILQLTLFRALQGIGGGVIIPTGLGILLNRLPENQHAQVGAKIFAYETVLALGLGPIYAGIITYLAGWPWLFFLKLPISIACLWGSFYLKETNHAESVKPFSWKSFFILTIGLILFLGAVTTIQDQKVPLWLDFLVLIFSFVILSFFPRSLEGKDHFLFIHRELFKKEGFILSNIIQSIMNLSFLGSMFVIALFLQSGLKFSIIKTGFLFVALALGAVFGLLIVRRLYETVKALPLLVIGFALFSFSMFSFLKVVRDTSTMWIAFLLFLEGCGAWMVRTTNATATFSGFKPEEIEWGRDIYNFLRLISACLGVAITTMMLHINLAAHKIVSLSWAIPELVLSAYQWNFILQGILPLVGIILCVFYKTNQTKKFIEP